MLGMMRNLPTLEERLCSLVLLMVIEEVMIVTFKAFFHSFSSYVFSPKLLKSNDGSSAET